MITEIGNIKGSEVRVVGVQAEKIAQGLKKLKTHGGKGDPNIALIGGESLIIRHTVARQIAKDIIEDAEKRYNRKLKGIPLDWLLQEVDVRCKGRECKPEAVSAELGKLKNKVWKNVQGR